MVQVTHLMVVLGTCTSLKKAADAFTLTRPSTGLSTGTPHYWTTSLCASKRRGKLGNNIALNEDGEISRIMTKKEKMGRGGSKMNNRRGGMSSGSGGEAAINNRAICSSIRTNEGPPRPNSRNPLHTQLRHTNAPFLHLLPSTSRKRHLHQRQRSDITSHFEIHPVQKGHHQLFRRSNHQNALLSTSMGWIR